MIMAVSYTHLDVYKRQEHEQQAQAAQRISVLWGRVAPPELVVIEDGLRFAVDLQLGQKTGLFLDQRENRRFIEQISACLLYTSRFGLGIMIISQR